MGRGIDAPADDPSGKGDVWQHHDSAGRRLLEGPPGLTKNVICLCPIPSLRSGVDDERHIDESLPGGDAGEIRNPQHVGGRRPELPVL